MVCENCGFRLIENSGSAWCPVCRVAELEAENARLRDALQELYDWQNGPPLWSEKWLRGWGRAMDKARALLHEPLTVAEAQARHVCRICGGPDNPRRLGDELDPFLYNYGEEYAHESCLRVMKEERGNAESTRNSATDERREGNLDLADMIGSYLWDACEGDDLGLLERISQKAIRGWENSIRELLNRHGLNEFFDLSKNVRRQKESE